MKCTKIERCSRDPRRLFLVTYRRHGRFWSVRTLGVLRGPHSWAYTSPSSAEDGSSRLGDGLDSLLPPPAPILPPPASRVEPAAVKVASAPPSSTSGAEVLISYIHYLGVTKRTQADEFIEIYNAGSAEVDLSSWRIEAGDPNQAFVFPAGARLRAKERCRVFTNQETGEPSCFSFQSKRALWNDDGDLGRLLNASGVEISSYGYGDRETRSLASITRAHGIPELEVVYDPRHLHEHQSQRGRIDFLTAVERAIRCLLEAPLSALVGPGSERRQGHESLSEDPHMLRNRELLGRKRLRLLHTADLRAEEGGRLAKEWLFRLEGAETTQPRVAVPRSGMAATLLG